MEVSTVAPFLPTSYLDYYKSGKKSTISFNQEFIKTLTIMRVKKNFCGKLCASVLFNGVTFIAAIFLILRQLGFQNEKYM